MTKRNKGDTRRSESIAGDAGNYDWPVVFDKTGDYVGITQDHGKGMGVERVLLSPAQVRAFLAFAKPRRRRLTAR